MSGELFRLTHSKIETFRRCRKQYWFAYVSGLPWPEQEQTTALIVGNAVHRAMQKLCDTGHPDDGYSELDAYLRMPKHALAAPGTEGYAEALACYEAGIAAHASIASEARWAEIDSWAPWERGGISLRSRADRVDRLAPDRWLVIDWKTGRFEVEDATDRQLDLAHVIVRVVQRLPAEAMVRAVAWNLRTGQQRVRELTRQDALNTLVYAARMAERMQAEEEFLANPGPHCGFCAWRGRCEAAARLEAEGLDWLMADGEELPEAERDFEPG